MICKSFWIFFSMLTIFSSASSWFSKNYASLCALFSTSSMLSKFSTFDDSSCVGKPYVFNALYTVDKRARKPVLPVNGTKQY